MMDKENARQEKPAKQGLRTAPETDLAQAAGLRLFFRIARLSLAGTEFAKLTTCHATSAGLLWTHFCKAVDAIRRSLCRAFSKDGSCQTRLVRRREIPLSVLVAGV
jgi:hypothetical protein